MLQVRTPGGHGRRQLAHHFKALAQLAFDLMKPFLTRDVPRGRRSVSAKPGYPSYEVFPPADQFSIEARTLVSAPISVISRGAVVARLTVVGTVAIGTGSVGAIAIAIVAVTAIAWSVIAVTRAISVGA